MKTGFERGAEGTIRKIKGCATLGLILLAAWPVTAAPSVEVATASPAPTAPSRPVLRWIDDVVKMNSQGVPADVIKSYINNFTSRSTLAADDIIYLRDHGLPSDLITAMIEHGAAVPMVATATPAQTPPPAPVTYQAQPYQPAVTYAATAPAPDYYYPQPDTYSYSYAYAYPNFYPSYWYPYTTFFVLNTRHRGGDFFRDDHRHFGGLDGGMGLSVRNRGVSRTIGPAHVNGGVGGHNGGAGGHRR